VATWGEFVKAEPELAAFGADLLRAAPAYLATVRSDCLPRVHPITPIVAADDLFLFTEPTSPKGRDLRERGNFAMHNGVPDSSGTGGEFWLFGRAVPVDDPSRRAAAVGAASYTPADRYVLFELLVQEARCNGYGDVQLPDQRRWRSA
jgi:hypothetical protein